MEISYERPATDIPEWAVPVKQALEKLRGLSGKKRKKKLPVTHRDIERELSWHDKALAEGTMDAEHYWKAVAQTLHDYGVYDMAGGGYLLDE